MQYRKGNLRTTRLAEGPLRGNLVIKNLTMRYSPKRSLVAVLLVCQICLAAGISDVRVGHLRCEDINEPIGIDQTQPRLSWQLYSSQRSQRQSAYRILVASDLDLLEDGKADLWDTGKILSDRCLDIPYQGSPLRSSQKVFWKVMVWDKDGLPSNWSRPSCWTMGIMSESDWQGAKWITDKPLLDKVRTHIGYKSIDVDDRNTSKWIRLDLGGSYNIELIRLHAVRYGAVERLGFPIRFRIEVSDDSKQDRAISIADFTNRDYPNTWANIIEIKPQQPVVARYVILTATKLRVNDGKACLAFSQIEVISNGRNVAPGAVVSATDSIEDDRWSAGAIVDGRITTQSDELANSTLILRKEFVVNRDLKRAVAHLSGLGQYHLIVNGRNVGNAFLSPGWTVYDKTCLYDSYDLTSLLQVGGNCISLILAGGMYNCQPGRYTKFVSPFRPLTAKGVIVLEYIDDSLDYIVTDNSWQVHRGPITFSNIYGGEDYDPNLLQEGWDRPGFLANGWKQAVSWSGPGGILRGAASSGPQFCSHQILEPVAVHRLRPDLLVYDFGQNAAIAITITASGRQGAKIRVTPAELLNKDGTVDRTSCGGGQAYWSYTLGPSLGPQGWQPMFFYQGARYVQVELIPSSQSDELPVLESIKAMVVHSDCSPIGQFHCSNDLFNRIRLLVRWAQRSNLASVITDCPHREKLGWLEQYHLNGPSLRYEWDMARLYRKCFQDMADSQQQDGLVPDIAPEYVIFPDGFRDSPEWGSALILAAWQQYLFSADQDLLLRYYPSMRRYIQYLLGRSVDHILSYGLGDWYDIGPRRPGVSQLTPIGLTATAILYEDLCTMARIARVIGRSEDAHWYQSEAQKVRAAFNKRFFDPDKGWYGTGSQTAQAMALVLGMVDPGNHAKVLDVLIKDIKAKGFTAGDVGYRYVLRALAQSGRSDLIADICSDANRPGYAYQLEKGATSLTEAWDADRRSSQNHFMLGQVIEWFYHDLAGIQPDPNSPGFKRIRFHPSIIPSLSWVKASYQSRYGLVSAGWFRRSDGKVDLELTIPPNTTGQLHLAVADPNRLYISGLAIEDASGIRLVSYKDGMAVYALESGSYNLQLVR